MRRLLANPRLVVMPLLILAVAAALAVWGSKQRQRTTEQVRGMVQQVCYEMAHDGDAQRLAGTDPMVARPLLSQLRDLLEGQALDTLEIDVAAGDVDEIGSAQQPATHIAVIRVAGTERLGLRLLHSGDDEQITVIGFWTP